ncbi:MAG: hypothetical protein LBH14_02330 [Desulfobulbaceae bacterium]|nr:hypothetical protein [Desulfobulbaceae bacterium]
MILAAVQVIGIVNPHHFPSADRNGRFARNRRTRRAGVMAGTLIAFSRYRWHGFIPGC